MNTFATIYKRTATGAVQQWNAEIEGSKYRTISGQMNGALTTSEWTQCEYTNKGRSNERTPEEQAIFEVNALYKKRLEKDYHRYLEDIDKQKIFKPTLAKNYKDYRDKVFKTGLAKYAQPKLDGVRCIIKADGMWTRTGKPITSCPHIFDALKPLFEKRPDIVFDGELYNHEFKDDFNALVSMIKKQNQTPETLSKTHEHVQYHTYDMVYENMPSFMFHERIPRLAGLVDKVGVSFIVHVDTYQVQSARDVDLLYENFIENGYEGLMLREDSVYENKRSKNLLKLKELLAEEFIVEDIQSGKGNWAGKAKRALLVAPNGEIFGAGIKGTMQFCEKLLANKDQYIGNPATVEFQMYTPDGIPRFGRVKEFNREDA